MSFVGYCPSDKLFAYCIFILVVYRPTLLAA